MTDPVKALTEAARALLVEFDCGTDISYVIGKVRDALARYDAAKDVREAERAIVAEAERLDHVDPYRITTAMSIAVRKRAMLLAARKALEVKG